MKEQNITFEELTGTGQYLNLGTQLNFPAYAYDIIRWSAVGAWKKLPHSGAKREELSKIRQGPNEPFSDFVSQLLLVAGRLLEDAEAGNVLVKELAFENANSVCQSTLHPWKGRGTLNNYIGSRYAQGLSMAVA